MLRYCINLLFLLAFTVSYTQGIGSEQKDTIYLNKYGLRVGIDLYNPIHTAVDNNRKGLEIVGDYRISKKLFAATELGYLENTTDEDFMNFTTNGSYIKLGVDYNAYENWLDMENMIYVGFRYGFSVFNHTLNSYIINNDAFYDDLTSPKNGQNFNNLNAHWGEIILGVKAEVLTNLYMGFSFSGKKMISSKQPNNFKNLFVPGFNRVFLNNSGFGFNYTISYLIPFYKKEK
ncbi:hypothetical protein EGM88_01875 [Aureibaculum marinum]|uniref:Outer membrane protein beta-barrel domain-containing protein n=1 Tax=Aureibaculum marinum TaxID=2487930 RepID=A0A3N4PK97_9FLAO|nr:DUF6048 family protein [Aureibaculum marinum]RPE00034.1 hypothetical protein EGM88_01875 [Aureibaculum marinum]